MMTLSYGDLAGEQALLEFIETIKSDIVTLKAKLLWLDFTKKWFTLLHATRPLLFHDYQVLANNVN